jgi:hypothetical protein
MQMSNIIKISPEKLHYLNKQKDTIEMLNSKLQHFRKQHLYSSLKESTVMRNELIQKVRNWINVLETRIFDPVTIQEMDINKVISLFKYIGTVSLKLLAQMNDMEALLKTYTESVNIERTNQGMNPITNSDEIKKEIMQAFVESLNKKAEDVIVRTEVSNVVDEDEKVSDVPLPVEKSDNIEREIPEIKPIDVSVIEPDKLNPDKPKDDST